MYMYMYSTVQYSVGALGIRMEQNTYILMKSKTFHTLTKNLSFKTLDL